MEYLRALKTAPCADCGESYPYFIMEFDHVPTRGGKVDNLSRMAKLGLKSAKFQAELKKCDVVCANCHKVRTFIRNLTKGAIVSTV